MTSMAEPGIGWIESAAVARWFYICLGVHFLLSLLRSMNGVVLPLHLQIFEWAFIRFSSLRFQLTFCLMLPYIVRVLAKRSIRLRNNYSTWRIWSQISSQRSPKTVQIPALRPFYKNSNGCPTWKTGRFSQDFYRRNLLENLFSISQGIQ